MVDGVAVLAHKHRLVVEGDTGDGGYHGGIPGHLTVGIGFDDGHDRNTGLLCHGFKIERMISRSIST